VIQRYVALTDSAALGLGLNVFTSISLKDQPRESLAEFERRIDEQDEIMECYLRTGDSDYLITRRLARHRSARALHPEPAHADPGNREDPVEFCAQISSLQDGTSTSICSGLGHAERRQSSRP